MWKSKVWNEFKAKPFLAFLLIGAFSFLISFSFAPYRYSYLAFFSLIPLFYFIQKPVKAREAWIYGIAAGLPFFLFHLRWLLVFGWLPWLALVFYQALFWGLACYFVKLALERNFFWLSPFLWVGVEFLRSTGSAGFGWGLLGLSQTDSFLSLIYPFFGVWGASFILVGFNLLASRLLLKKKIFWLGLSVAFLILSSVLFEILSRDDNFVSGSKNFLTTVLVQTAIPQREKISGEAESLFLKFISRLEEKNLEKDSLVIFPETAYPYSLSANSEVQNKLFRLARNKRSWILTGAFRQDGDKTYNSAFLFSPEGELKIYDKVHLVPFGEFWPFRPYLSWLPYASLIKEDLSPGRNLKPLPLNNILLGTAICFESSDSFLIWKLVRSGADILVLITNDSWFDGTEALAQHFQIAQARAAEAGRVVLQIANTGYTGVISKEGKILAQAELSQPVFLTESISLQKARKTFFISFGYLFPLVASFLTLLFLIYYFFRLRFLAKIS